MQRNTAKELELARKLEKKYSTPLIPDHLKLQASVPPSRGAPSKRKKHEQNHRHRSKPKIKIIQDESSSEEELYDQSIQNEERDLKRESNVSFGLETPEEIQVWRNERKKQFPSNSRLEILSRHAEVYPEMMELNPVLKQRIKLYRGETDTRKPKRTPNNVSNCMAMNDKRLRDKNSTILEWVLKDQVLEEQVWILQAIRYITKHNLFKE